MPIDETDAMAHLDNIDESHGVNTKIEKTEVVTSDEPNKVTSLGKAKTYESVKMSAAGESPWKVLDLNLLPSSGMFYDSDIELLLKSAKTKEIRHWSTIDEMDPVDVRDKIGFILNSCTKFKIKGSNRPFNFKDFLEVDKYHIMFRIHELTFPNQENKLMANIRCTNQKCKKVNRIQVSSQNLKGFNIPDELIQYYNEDEKCFIIHSEKLGETLKFYMPTTGIHDLFRKKQEMEISAGQEVDKAFYGFGPYLVNNWREITMRDISELKIDSNAWSPSKFTVIHKITEMLKKESVNKATGVCEKCKERLETSIFLGGSFTVKDIFIISAGLNELI